MTFPPNTAEDLLDALADGRHPEHHELDFKRQLPSGRSANRELAADIASFAIDGGLLVIGVEEDKEARTFMQYPIPLEGLAERVDQVVDGLIRPRLTIRSRELPHGEEGHGFLIIEIPASPLAPHMANERYWGRGDQTKHALPDAEVRELYDRREQHRQRLEGLLEKEIARDPMVELQIRGRLFVVMAPAVGRGAILQEALQAEGQDGRLWIADRILSGPPMQTGPVDPDLSMASTVRRARGWALHGSSLTAERRLLRRDAPMRPTELAGIEDHLIDLEIDEDATLHFLSGRVSLREDHYILVELVITEHTLMLLRIANEASITAGYGGPWYIGAALTGIEGAESLEVKRGLPIYSRSFYSEPSYKAGGEFPLERIQDDPNGILDDLYGQLWRAVGSSFTAANLGT